MIMSQPNRLAELAEAREQYEQEKRDFLSKFPHTPIGDCTSGCGKDFDCPKEDLLTFEEWCEELNSKYRED